jgi:2,4-dienoyl-CoA reductase (NADPH2)
MTMSVPQGAFTYLAQTIKDVVSIPVMASNRISEPWMAEKILRDGCADMVNIGRVLMADSYWPAKAYAGHPEQIAPCVACLQGCMDEVMNANPAKCMVNARLGFEGERWIAKTERPKRIMVIGAGPGGLEAAFRASQAGHRVELYEKADDIGGQLWIAGAPPHKQDLWRLITYYKEMIKLYKVEIFLNTAVDIELIRQINPEYIIAAEGAEIVVPAIDGINNPGVYSAWEVLKNNVPLGKRIAVIGGGAVGLETAHFIAVKGTISAETLHFLFSNDAQSPERLRQLVYQGNKEVSVFEMMSQAGNGVGKSSKWGLMASLDKHGVKIFTQARVCSFKDGLLTFELDGQLHSAPFDNVINASGSKPVRKLAEALEDAGIPYSVIGDSLRPGQITDAIHQAYLCVMTNL